MTGSATHFLGAQGRSLLYSQPGVPLEAKPFKSYTEQAQILQSRGMEISDVDWATQILRSHNYYRLAGYWHSMRALDPVSRRSLDTFRDGASLELVIDLYDFDARLRNTVFSNLASIELRLRALIGHELGRLDPLIHLDETRLGAPARKSSHNNPRHSDHAVWLKKYTVAVTQSREDFIKHHKDRYKGSLPVWVAVEGMDWGMLSYLYRFSPNPARAEIASVCGMTAPQLESWLKSLNILRNYAAHHARLFTRVFDIKPKGIADPRMQPIHERSHLLFGQLSLIRYLQKQLGSDQQRDLIEILDSYPHNRLVPFYRTGAPTNWHDLEIWQDSAPT